jgi:hypothetical protein
MSEVGSQSERSWFPGGPVPTTITIAGVAAVTAGLLALTGVGNGESSEERIDRAVEELARGILQDSPETCDVFELLGSTGYSEILVGDVDESSTISDLTADDWRTVSGRLVGELRVQCEELGR